MNCESRVAKLNNPGKRRKAKRNQCRRPEVWIVDDTQPEIGLPPELESGDSVTGSNPAESLIPATATTELTPTSAIPTNGSSPRKIAANRSNAKKSTGPKTSLGKTVSAWNSTRHGLLSKRLPLLGRSKRQFTRLLSSLQRDLEPVGTLEEVLVEKIAQEYWRLGVAAWYEEDLERQNPFKHPSIDRILRYQTTINRQLFQAMNQLERLQRLRKGENLPASLTLQVSHDVPTISDHDNSEG